MTDFLLGALLGVLLPPLAFVLACLWRRVWDEHDEGRAVMWWDRE